MHEAIRAERFAVFMGGKEQSKEEYGRVEKIQDEDEVEEEEGEEEEERMIRLSDLKSK